MNWLDKFDDVINEIQRIDKLKSENKSKINKIEGLLKNLKGIEGTYVVPTKQYYNIYKIECRKEKELEKTLVYAKNLGVRDALKREVIFAILKNNDFRKPTKPTIILAEEVDNSNKDPNSIIIEKQKYRILGEEVFDQSLKDKKELHGEEFLFLSQKEKSKLFLGKLESEIIYFPKRIKDRKEKIRPSYFVLPPIEFPELEQEKDYFGIDNIISASPHPVTDAYIRNEACFSKNKDLATILIGFNFKNNILNISQTLFSD